MWLDVVTRGCVAVLLEPEVLADSLLHCKHVILDVGAWAVYSRAHVPGARWVDRTRLMAGSSPAPGCCPAPEVLAELWSSLGLLPGASYVVYDDEGGGWAARLIWSLRLFGIPNDRLHLLNGGVLAWLKLKAPITAAVPDVVPSSSSTDWIWSGEVLATLDDVRLALADPKIQFWDARSLEEFSGLRSGSVHHGHIPGARSLPWDQLFDTTRCRRLHPRSKLIDRLLRAGLDPEHLVITYCQSHHRSALAFWVAEYLGYAARGYAGSWGEYGNQNELPINPKVLS